MYIVIYCMFMILKKIYIYTYKYIVYVYLSNISKINKNTQCVLYRIVHKVFS